VTNSKYQATRLRGGLYLYRGFEIHGYPYYEPAQRAAWEAWEGTIGAFAHSYTLRDTKKLIDDHLNGALVYPIAVTGNEPTPATHSGNSESVQASSLQVR